MSIHSNLSLLLENIDNPEIFNLHLDNPNDIVKEIFKDDDLQKMKLLHNIFTEYYEEDMSTYTSISKEKAKYYIKLLCKERKIDKIFIYCIYSIKIKYLPYFVKHINNFNERDQLHIKWILNKIDSNFLDKHNLTLGYVSELYDGIFNVYAGVTRVEKHTPAHYFGRLFIMEYKIKNDLSREYYNKWKIHLSEFWKVFYSN